MSEVDAKRKAALIEKYRDFNVNYDNWWDGVYSAFIDRMYEKGINTTAKNMSFSGFWCQGDGASFTGYITDDRVFLDAHPQLKADRPMMLKLVYEHDGGLGISIDRISHHYVHENTVGVSVDHDWFYQILDGTDPLRTAVIEEWDRQLDDEMTGFWQEVQEIVRDYCQELYSNLEKEYDYLTSDEAVWEAITANDLDEYAEEDEEDEDEYA